MAFESTALEIFQIDHEQRLEECERFLPDSFAVTVCGGGEKNSVLGTALLKEYK